MVGKLFTYGTLQDPDVQQRMIGRLLGNGTPDTLNGYAMGKLTGIFGEYNIIYPQPDTTIKGIVYNVSEDDLSAIDEYEGDAYMRVVETLASNTRAWVYRNDPNSRYTRRIITDDN